MYTYKLHQLGNFLCVIKVLYNTSAILGLLCANPNAGWDQQRWDSQPCWANHLIYVQETAGCGIP